MSKGRNNIPRAAIHVGAPAKSFSAAEGYEPERRGWDEKTYRLKNQDSNNHYDFSRKHLNFEINDKGQIVPLGSNPMPLHERLQKRLDELGFKPYVAPALSSGALQLLLTLRGQWHCSSVCLGDVWFGVRNRFTPAGLELETASLPDALFARLQETETLLRAII